MSCTILKAVFLSEWQVYFLLGHITHIFHSSYSSVFVCVSVYVCKEMYQILNI
jgi:hypothetical protein